MTPQRFTNNMLICWMQGHLNPWVVPIYCKGIRTNPILIKHYKAYMVQYFAEISDPIIQFIFLSFEDSFFFSCKLK